MLSQLDPVHTVTSYFLKIHLNIIFPSTPVSPKWSLSLSFPHEKLLYTSPLPHARYMLCPAHSSWFNHPNNTGLGVQIIQFLIMQLHPLPCYLVPVRPKYSPQHPILKHPQPGFLPRCHNPQRHETKNAVDKVWYKRKRSRDVVPFCLYSCIARHTAVDQVVSVGMEKQIILQVLANGVLKSN